MIRLFSLKCNNSVNTKHMQISSHGFLGLLSVNKICVSTSFFFTENLSETACSIRLEPGSVVQVSSSTR